MCRRTTSIRASSRSVIAPLLCESLALSQQLIGLDYSTQPRFETAIAAIAVGMIFADEFAVAAAQRPAIGVRVRKRVGEGKRVSVRVDLGGRRLMQKKQQNHLLHFHTLLTIR